MTFAASPLRADVRENIEYSHPGGFSLQMDARIPEGEGPFPAVIVVHGGGWVSGDRRYNVQPLFAPLQEAGFASFSISYRLLSDPMNFGIASQDVWAAVRYVRAHAAEFNVDPKRIALIGESAGAHLASMAALRGVVGEEVRGVVSIYGPTDLEQLARTSNLVPPSIREQVKGTAWEQVLLAGLRQLSPVRHVRADAPPFLLIHGTADTVVPIEQSQTFCDRLRAEGGTCDLYTVPGGGHGIRWWESTRDLASGYKQRMVEWLKRHV